MSATRTSADRMIYEYIRGPLQTVMCHNSFEHALGSEESEELDHFILDDRALHRLMEDFEFYLAQKAILASGRKLAWSEKGSVLENDFPGLVFWLTLTKRPVPDGPVALAGIDVDMFASAVRIASDNYKSHKFWLSDDVIWHSNNRQICARIYRPQ